LVRRTTGDSHSPLRDSATISNLRKSLHRRSLRGALVARFATTTGASRQLGTRRLSKAPLAHPYRGARLRQLLRPEKHVSRQSARWCLTSAARTTARVALAVRSSVERASRVATELRTLYPSRSRTEGVPVEVRLVTANQHLNS